MSTEETGNFDRWGVPRAFVSIAEAEGGYTFVEPNSSDLPLSLAPAAVKRAVSAADKAEQKLEAADDKAAELFARYQAVPRLAQQEVEDAVSRGEDPPSLSKLIDERQRAMADPLRDAIANRDALRTVFRKASEVADTVRRRHRFEWRDATAAHIGEQLPKVREKLQGAVNDLATCLNEANSLEELKRLCALVDAEWIEQRTPTVRITPAQTMRDYERSIPEVYERDREYAAHRRSTDAPVDVISEAEKRVRWLAPYHKGGWFPDSLFVPLSAHAPVERRADDE
jgi:hypothetical protein